MAFCSSNQTSSSTIIAIHETQDRTLLTVILRFTTFFILVNYLAKNVNSEGALANFSLCSAVHLPFAKKKKKASIFGTYLCIWAVIALHLRFWD